MEVLLTLFLIGLVYIWYTQNTEADNITYQPDDYEQQQYRRFLNEQKIIDKYGGD